MLRTRLVVGLILSALACGLLVIDWWLHPWYPFLLVTMLGLTVLSCREMLDLLPPDHRPARWLCIGGAALVTFANWPAIILNYYEIEELSPWFFVLGAFIVVVMAAFILEMTLYRAAGGALFRISMLVWVVAYLALLPCFFVQIRWPPVNYPSQSAAGYHGSVALTMAVFVPKSCDIGAYLFGRFFGRHKMAPVLSPKKTWEGFAGGLLLAVVTTVALNRLFGPVLAGGVLTDLAAVGFGLTVGVTGVLGDLAESLIKRDCQVKDASRTIPGFGGVLDVVDSVIFAAPVAYCWLRFFSVPPGAGL